RHLRRCRMNEPMSDERLAEIRAAGELEAWEWSQLLDEIDRLRALEADAWAAEAQKLGAMLGDVTRVTVVHSKRGRDYERRDFDGVALVFQDDNRTLKVLHSEVDPRGEDTA